MLKGDEFPMGFTVQRIGSETKAIYDLPASEIDYLLFSPAKGRWMPPGNGNSTSRIQTDH